ncbi:hypothetical protein M426DRAFT_28512 [Hypoxylon sp. CI-4A]|nr:hypothetical protein M426DRAFT_28512 [Hypoxylon sp. CI-4A]
MTVSMAADGANLPAFGGSHLQENKPSSGFTPLPPIRRTSTFDLLSRRKLGGDEDDSEPSPVGSSDNDVPPVPPIEKDMKYQNGNGYMAGQGQGVQATGNPNQPQNYSQPPQQQSVAFSNGPIQPNGFAPGVGVHQVNGFQHPQQQQQQQQQHQQSQFSMGRGGPVDPRQYGQMPGQPGPMSMQNPNAPFMQMGGNPIQKFPPGGQWKLEESHLSEPLIQHKRPGANTPPQQQPNYNAYDKETEDAAPPVKGPGVSGPRPRNNSNSIPPVSAERFAKRGIFAPNGHQQSPALHPPQGIHPSLRNQSNGTVNQPDRGVGEAGPSKEMDVRIEEVSISSEDQPDKGRRGSGFFGGLGIRRNTGSEQAPQNSDNASLKERGPFGGSSSPNKSQPNKKSNLGSSFDHDDTPERVPMKKRLSELTGMIKGVGNAKDGSKDDQSAKTSNSRPSMQGMRSQQGPIGPSPLGMGERSSTSSRPSDSQREEGGEKKHGFLGGLFNKQGSKSSESKQANPQGPVPPPRPQQFTVQPGQQFRPGPGQMPPPGQQFGPQPPFAGQPPNQQGPQRQAGMRQPTAPGQLSPIEDIRSPTSPQFFGTAQAVMIRRPSEITVSQNQAGGSPLSSPGQRGQNAYQPGPQGNVRPSTAQGAEGRNFSRQSQRDDFSVSGALPNPKESLQLSRQSSREQFDGRSSPTATRSTPTRKPVGSGFPKQDGASAGSPMQNPRQPMSPTRPNDLSQPGGADGENRLSGQLPSGQQSPTLGKLGHVRQTSSPIPGRVPTSSQPGQVTFQSSGDQQFSPRGPRSSHDQQLPGRSYGVSQGQPGMPQQGQSSVGYQSPIATSPQRDPRLNPQVWPPNVSLTNSEIPGPFYQNNGFPNRPIGNVAIPPNQHTTLAKFFGTETPKNFGSTPIPKEKEKSAASRFLGALKRGSKQSDPNPSPQKPPPNNQIPPNMSRNHQGGLTSPQQSNMPRPPMSGPSPTGPLGPMSNLPPGQSKGQPLQPPMMHGAGRGEPPSQAQASHGQNVQFTNLKPPMVVPRRRSAQDLEPHYDQVPIPRGYEAVHGYGNAGMLAPSPYNVGRPSPPPAQHQPFQPFVSQQGHPEQQLDPRMMAAHGQRPPQMAPGQQGPPRSLQRPSDSESSTPTPSDPGTFLDMATTPPPPNTRDELKFDPSEPPAVPAQYLRNQPSQQDFRTRSESVTNQARAPQPQRIPDPAVHNPVLQSKPSDLNISPPSDGGDVQHPQQQHIATAMNNTPNPTMIYPGQSHPQAHPQPQPGPYAIQTARPFSPTAQAPSIHNESPIVNLPPQNLITSAGRDNIPVATSPTPEPPRNNNASLSPDVIANRATSVSPEPPGARPEPYHQVSNTSLNINVDRANDLQNGEDDDIYGATPRMKSSEQQNPNEYQNPSLGQGQEHTNENIKYAGSEKSRSTINVAAVGGVAAGAATVVAIDAGVQESVSNASDPSPPQRQITMHMEPEEKILVDQPVELAAVNDDDDGIPVMSATSYPGQEWNPYGAGEFGDWD